MGSDLIKAIEEQAARTALMTSLTTTVDYDSKAASTKTKLQQNLQQSFKSICSAKDHRNMPISN